MAEHVPTLQKQLVMQSSCMARVSDAAQLFLVTLMLWDAQGIVMQQVWLNVSVGAGEVSCCKSLLPTRKAQFECSQFKLRVAFAPVFIGYQRQLLYKHDDGSYSAFGKSDTQGNTW